MQNCWSHYSSLENPFSKRQEKKRGELHQIPREQPVKLELGLEKKY